MGWGGKGKGSWGGDGGWGGDGNWGGVMNLLAGVAMLQASKGHQSQAASGKGWGRGWGATRDPKGRLASFGAHRTVYVSNVPETNGLNYHRPSEEGHKKLKEFMSQAGRCVFLSVHNGQGGVVFTSADEAQKAVNLLNGQYFEGNQLSIDLWKQKKDQQ
eukprot:TRINITY_DN874_c0_g1_i1.p1 TRINITY_DN874_c0_g1~~TRINITY_DN874_c0_g1_i1.p1  ORF type:complete len:159 (-),score=44.98 TRINITY_DN874_c0_g1_i1:101-577(-)